MTTLLIASHKAVAVRNTITSNIYTMDSEQGACNCPICGSRVKDSHQALECDLCGCWVHRRRCTTISAEDYTTAIQRKQNIPFVCSICVKKRDKVSKTLRPYGHDMSC